MKYWLMANVVHVADFPFWLQTHEWNVYLDMLDERVREGDILYLANGEMGVYAWGILHEKGKQQSDEQWRIKIGRGAIKPSLISREQILQNKELSTLLSFSEGRFAFLSNKQVSILNALMPPNSSKPSSPRRKQFIHDESLDEDEGLYTEYKEVKPNNIPNEAYEFAVAYVAGEGGCIYFGIRDKDKKVVGSVFNYAQRDEIKRKIENKLFSIRPSLHANKDYFMEFYTVIDSRGNEIPELYVFELEIKPGSADKYTTAGGRVIEKTYSGRRILNDSEEVG